MKPPSKYNLLCRNRNINVNENANKVGTMKSFATAKG